MLVISRFCFEGWIWVLTDSVPDLCILLNFNTGGIAVNDSDRTRLLMLPLLMMMTFYFTG